MSDTPLPGIDFGKSRFEIKTLSGVEYKDIKLMPGDVVAAERKYEMKAAELEGGASMEVVLFMVWRAAKRKGYEYDYERFLDEVEELDIQSGAEQGNPTQLAQ